MLGCFERSLFPEVSRSALVLAPQLAVPGCQGCCGALHAHNGEPCGVPEPRTLVVPAIPAGRRMLRARLSPMLGQVLPRLVGVAQQPNEPGYRAHR